jgi:hypothetical protein
MKRTLYTNTPEVLRHVRSAGIDAVTCLAHGEGDSDDALALDAQTEPSRTLYRHARVSTSERDRIAQVISTVSSPCRR